jgi:uncharacterized membrane protein YgcG
MRNLLIASLLASSVAACNTTAPSPYGYTLYGRTVVANGYHNGTVVSNRQVLRAPAPRAVTAITATIHQHGRVDVSYPWWDAQDPFQPWKSNYAPNLNEAGNNDGGNTGGDSSGGHSSSSNGNGSSGNGSSGSNGGSTGGNGNGGSTY